MAVQSYEASSIAETPNFQRRVRFSIVKVATLVLNEPLSTPGHTERIAYARKVMSGEYDLFSACLAVWTDDALKASGNTTNQETFGLTDAEVIAAITAKFSAIAGVEGGI